MTAKELKPRGNLDFHSKEKATFYIAGPVSNVDDGNFQSFKEVANQISEAGHIALYTSLLPKGLSEADYMKFAHAMLEVCDVVVLLPRWSLSDGATAEYHWAVKLDKPIIRKEHLPKILTWWNSDSHRGRLLSAASNEVKEMVSGSCNSQKSEVGHNEAPNKEIDDLTLPNEGWLAIIKDITKQTREETALRLLREGGLISEQSYHTQSSELKRRAFIGFSFNEVKSIEVDDLLDSVATAMATGCVDNKMELVINMGKLLELYKPEVSNVR